MFSLVSQCLDKVERQRGNREKKFQFVIKLLVETDHPAFRVNINIFLFVYRIITY